MVGLRENERRMELLGYDSRRYKLMAFVIAGGLARPAACTRCGETSSARKCSA